MGREGTGCEVIVLREGRGGNGRMSESANEGCIAWVRMNPCWLKDSDVEC